MQRCDWAGDDPLYQAYDSRALWEKLILDGFQAGLSWITILRKRENFRAAFEGFDPHRVAEWSEAEVTRLLQDPGIIRHCGKIEAAITNARAWQEIEAREGFDNFMWRYVDGVPLQPRYATQADVPPKTPLSEQVSRDLKKAGCKFCGPTITYAWMEACGLVNDHILTCHRHAPCAAMAEAREIAR